VGQPAFLMPAVMAGRDRLGEYQDGDEDKPEQTIATHGNETA